MIKGEMVNDRIIFNELPRVGINVFVEDWGYAMVRDFQKEENDHLIELEWYKGDSPHNDFDYLGGYKYSVKQGFKN